jgi:hypothetical protein
MTASELELKLQQNLIRDWGYCVGSAGLRQALGYPSQAALRQAIGKGLVPVKVFQIPGRKGPFALAHDLAAWLASHETLVDPGVRPKPRRNSQEKS